MVRRSCTRSGWVWCLWMAKKQSFGYSFIKDTIKTTHDRRAVAVLLSIALEKWRDGEFKDVVFADILWTAAKKYIDIE